jgi:hypothetical protein
MRHSFFSLASPTVYEMSTLRRKFLPTSQFLFLPFYLFNLFTILYDMDFLPPFPPPSYPFIEWMQAVEGLHR